MYFSGIDTPLGRLRLCTSETAVLSLQPAAGDPLFRPDDPVGRDAAKQLEEYFAGTRTAFSLPLSPAGTEFQQKVWRTLTEIPFGETRSYGQIAEKIGCPRGTRAVGGAVGRNPILLLIPCHRVIASDGIGGFSAGLDVKRALLLWEGNGFLG